MKKILLLGDSIRVSYQQLVKGKLDGLAEIIAPEENCRFAKYTLWCIDQWLVEWGKPDIVHWNNGLWDVYYQTEEKGIFTPLGEYLKDIGRILKEIRKTGAQIIWATTTPVSKEFSCVDNNDVDRYNEAAVNYMKRENIVINDLNRVLRRNVESFISEDRLHLNEAGVNECAEAVAGYIKRYL